MTAKEDDVTPYRAFISYSHVDKKWGDWLHNALETYRVPAGLVGQPNRTGPVPKRLYPIFRDREELPTATSLTEQIEQALKHSEYLIVICSPRAAKSMWVNEEILQFKRIGRSDRILAIVVDGEPNGSDKPGLEEHECFPPGLRFEIDDSGELSQRPTEPIAADARKRKDGRQAAKLKLIAGLLGVKYDALAQRDMRRKRSRRVFLAALGTVAFFAFFGLWYYGEVSRKAEKRERLLGESQRLAELAEREIEKGLYDRAMLLALNGLPGVHGGERPLVDSALSMLKAAFIEQHKSMVFDPAATVENADLQGSRARFSPDGSRVVTSAEDGTVVVWDAEAGVEITRLVGHSDYVESVVFSPDGNWLASGSGDEQVKIWDAITGALVATFDEGTSEYNEFAISSITFSPDSETLAAAFRKHGDTFMEDGEGYVKLWDVGSGELLATLGQRKVNITSVDFNHDGTLLATGAEDNTILLWDVASGAAVQTLEAHTDWVQSVSFSPDGLQVASGSVDTTIRLWDSASGNLLRTLNGHSSSVNSVSFSPSGEFVASGAGYGTHYWHSANGEEAGDTAVKLWDAASGALIVTLEGHTNQVRSVAFSPDGTRLASASRDNAVKLWDVEDGMLLATFQGHLDSVNGVAFSPDGAQLASGSSDHTIKLWDIASGEEVDTLMSGGWISDNPFPPDGSRLLTTPMYSGAIVWDVVSGERLIAFDEASPMKTAFFSLDGQNIFTVPESGSVTIWDAKSGDKDLALPQADIEGYVSMSPNGQYLITSPLFSNGIEVWSTATGELLNTLMHEDDFRRAAFSSDSERLVTTSQDETVVIWDVSSGEALQSLGTADLVDHVVFSPDGTLIVTTYWRGGASIWDAISGEHVIDLQSSDSASLASFSPDGIHIVMAVEEGAALWDASTGNRIATFLDETGVSEVSFSPDGSGVLTASENGSATEWKVRDVEILQFLYDVPYLHYAVFNSAQDALIMAAAGGDVLRWDLTSLEPNYLLEGEEWWRPVVLSPDGSRAISSSLMEGSVLWDTDKANKVAQLDYISRYEATSFSPDSKLFVTIGSVGEVPSGLVSIYSTTSGERLARIEHEEQVTHVSFSPDSERIVTASDDDTAVIWNALTGERYFRLPHDTDRYLDVDSIESNNDVLHAEFSPDGTLLVTASANGTAAIWNAQTGERVHILEHGDSVVRGASFSPDSTRLVTTTMSGSVAIWDAISGSRMFKLRKDHGYYFEEWESHATFSPDSSYLATFSVSSNEVWIWDVGDGRLLATLRHSGTVEHVAFSPGGENLVTVSGRYEDDDVLRENGVGRVTIWSVPPSIEEVLSRPFAHLPVNRTCLTPQERDRYSLLALSDQDWIKRRCAQLATGN